MSTRNAGARPDTERPETAGHSGFTRPTGRAAEEIEAVAVLLDRLRRQYGDRQWSEQEVVTAMEQILAEAPLDSAMQSIGL